MRPPYAAGCAKADGRSGDTTPGTRNANPIKRKLCRISRGRNASARCLRRSSGQMYREVTIPQEMRLNAMLTKKQICGCIKVLLLEFQRSSAADGRGSDLVAARYRWLGGVADGVLASPDFRTRRELWHGWVRTAQFTVVPIQIEARGGRHHTELRQLAKPVAKAALVARLPSIAASDRLEVLGRTPSYIEHVGRRCS